MAMRSLSHYRLAGLDQEKHCDRSGKFDSQHQRRVPTPALSSADGSLLWTQSTDYVLPPSDWTPEFQPAIAPNGRVYFAGLGGTINWRDNIDSASGKTGQIAFYGLDKYAANKTKLNDTVFIDTPLTIDKNGNNLLSRLPGHRLESAEPERRHLLNIDANGNGTFVYRQAAAGRIPERRDEGRAEFGAGDQQ